LRRAFLAAALVLLAAAAAVVAQQPQQFEPIGPIQKVRNNLFMIPGQGGNTAVFVTRRGVVLVDTKLTGNGQAILDRVASVTDLPAKDPAVKDIPAAMPDRTFKDRLTIGEGPDRVELYYFGAAHTGGDAFVVFPSVRAMHAGDVYPWKAAPFVDDANGGSPVALPDTLEALLKTVRDVDSVIPGHMPVTTWAGLVEFTRFNRQLLTTARAARAAGRTVDQAVTELRSTRFADYVSDAPIPGLEFLGTGRERAKSNVEMVFKAK
jgi:glyoxylase-like metal-dependent hydrolase (beta-lactamase superfamily II)